MLLFSQEVNSTFEAGVEAFIRCLTARGASLLSGRVTLPWDIPVSEIVIYPEFELTAECEAVPECGGGGRMGKANSNWDHRRLRASISLTLCDQCRAL
jgi:hypothetical protein